MTCNCEDEKIFKKLIKGFIIFIILSIIFTAYIFVEPYWIEIKKFNIVSKDIPPSFSNLTIAHISDIHHGPFLSIDRVRQAVDKANDLNPDIICMTGDYVYKDNKYIEPCFKELQNLKAKIGKFAVLGNHDHWRNSTLIKQKMKECNVKVLDNDSSWVHINNEKIKIGGVGDLWEGNQDINKTVYDLKNDDFSILLCHNPDYTEELKTHKIDLTLCGHTHGGQVTFFGLWTPFTMSKYKQKYRSGFAKNKYTDVIISNGIGTVIAPVRFFARPQIVLITLVKSE